MKKRYLTTLAIASLLSPVSAQVQLEPTLHKTVQKVDTDGTYLEINKIDDDLSVLVEYGEMILDIAKKEEDDIPKGLNVKEIMKVLGLKQLKATAMSSKKVNGAWDNKAYLYAGEKPKGILSLYGPANAENVVASFAPETTDIALQLRLDLREAKGIAQEIASMIGERNKMDKEMNKSRPELKGLTAYELVDKMNVCVNLAIDLDRKNRFKPAPDVDIPTPDFVARLDGVAWVWQYVGDEMMKETNLPWQSKVEGGVTTYTLPENMQKHLQGYSPMIVVDTKTDFIWAGSKEAVVKAAMSNQTKKLKDGAAFKNTMASLPKNANSLFYVSNDLLQELVHQYEMADKKGLLNDKDFKTAQPIVNKLIADLTAANSGIVGLISVDDEGVFSALRAPFPVKNYFNQLLPYITMASGNNW